MRFARWILLTMLGLAASATSWAGPAYRITGVAVSTRDGSPVPYCRLTAWPTTPNPDGGMATTTAVLPGGARVPGGRGPGQAGQSVEATADASGRFSLVMPHGGNWRLAATARGFKTQNFDEHEGFFAAVVLSDAAPTYNLTFRVTPDAMIEGLVYDEAGEPVVQAQVSVELIPPPVPGTSAAAERPRQVGFGQTDDRGRYEIASLQPGNYRLRVMAQPWYAAGRGFQQTQPGQPAPPDPSLDYVYGPTWFPGTDDETAAQTIKLVAGEDRQADVHLTAIPSVHLKVPKPESLQAAPVENGQPQRGGRAGFVNQPQATISRVSSDGGGFGSTTMGALGNEWDFGGLSPGVYEVRLPGPDARTPGEVRQVEVKAGSPAVITLENAKPLLKVTVAIDGVAENNGTTVEFVDLETGRRINAMGGGRGRRPGGPGGMRGGVLDGDPGPDDATPSGRSAMLPAGKYEVFLTGGGGAYLTGLTGTGLKIDGRVVTVDGPGTLTVNAANSHGTVSGIAQVGGKPAEAAMVLLVPAALGQPGDFTSIRRDEANTDGSYTIANVVPGRYILVAIDRGWNVNWRSVDALGPYLLQGTPVEIQGGGKVKQELVAVAP